MSDRNSSPTGGSGTAFRSSGNAFTSSGTAFRSSGTNVKHRASDISGWLRKKRPRRIMIGFSPWQKFFFVLEKDNQCLKYWKTSDTTKEAAGTIPLSFVTKVCEAEKSKNGHQKRFVIELRGSDRSFELKGDTEAECKMWILSLQSMLSEVLNEHQAKNPNLKFWKPKELEKAMKETKISGVEDAAMRAKEQKKVIEKQITKRMNREEETNDVRRDSITNILLKGNRQPGSFSSIDRKKSSSRAGFRTAATRRKPRKRSNENFHPKKDIPVSVGREDEPNLESIADIEKLELCGSLKPNKSPSPASAEQLDEIFGKSGGNSLNDRSFAFLTPGGTGPNTFENRRISGFITNDDLWKQPITNQDDNEVFPISSRSVSAVASRKWAEPVEYGNGSHSKSNSEVIIPPSPKSRTRRGSSGIRPARKIVGATTE